MKNKKLENTVSRFFSEEINRLDDLFETIAKASDFSTLLDLKNSFDNAFKEMSDYVFKKVKENARVIKLSENLEKELSKQVAEESLKREKWIKKCSDKCECKKKFDELFCDKSNTLKRCLTRVQEKEKKAEEAKKNQGENIDKLDKFCAKITRFIKKSNAPEIFKEKISIVWKLYVLISFYWNKKVAKDFFNLSKYIDKKELFYSNYNNVVDSFKYDDLDIEKFLDEVSLNNDSCINTYDFCNGEEQSIGVILTSNNKKIVLEHKHWKKDMESEKIFIQIDEKNTKRICNIEPNTKFKELADFLLG